MKSIRVWTATSLLITAGMAGAPAVVTAAPAFLGPTPYLQASDSPFSGLAFSYFHLENFEDGLNTPGAASGTPGTFLGNPGIATDSVDGDDGTVDGSGQAGRSWYSGNVSSVIRFVFDAGVLGSLPTHVGLVWTDVAQKLSGPFAQGNVIFEAFGAGNASLGTVGPVFLGDGAFGGETAEDRFFGVIDGSGITAIEIRMPESLDWEVDHLQYGAAITAVSAPSTLPLMLPVLPAIAGWRRRWSTAGA